MFSIWQQVLHRNKYWGEKRQRQTVSHFICSAITKYRSLGNLSTINIYFSQFHSSGCWRSKIRTPANAVSNELGSLWVQDEIVFLWPHMLGGGRTKGDQVSIVSSCCRTGGRNRQFSGALFMRAEISYTGQSPPDLITTRRVLHLLPSP